IDFDYKASHLCLSSAILQKPSEDKSIISRLCITKTLMLNKSNATSELPLSFCIIIKPC
ncbi:hypothetical protein BgiMline_020950, partial [Biomphalaria glabrata]